MPAFETISTPAVPRRWRAVTSAPITPGHRVGVAFEGDKAGRADGVVGLDRRRVARCGKGTKPLAPAQVRHGRAPSFSCGEERCRGVIADELLQLGDRAGSTVRDLV
jgi:hypothetical protein